MTAWTGAQIAAALGLAVPDGRTFSGVSTDTRTLRSGDLFVALRGERFDAHTFLEQARARGAAAAVVRRGTPPVDGLPFFEVDDPLLALGLLARARRRRLPAGSPVVAVTGSSGKTSTKEMLRAALATRWETHATTGNLNNLIGVPLTVLAAPESAGALVIEAGASVPGEIARLRAVIEPSIAVITNVTLAHVAGFGSLAGVLREKLALVEGVPLAVVGTEPPELAAEARRRTRTIVAGLDAPAEVRPERCELDDAGRARLTWRGQAVTVPVGGLHQAENAMLALAAAEAAGAEPPGAVAALA
ncbi:MAG: Mur ligase family protein, partial [Gemmatimonadales bacterium]